MDWDGMPKRPTLQLTMQPMPRTAQMRREAAPEFLGAALALAHRGFATSDVYRCCVSLVAK